MPSRAPRWAGRQAAGPRVAEPSRRAEFVVDAGHPAFDGHFPGAPVLPGVVLLAAVLRAAGARAAAGWRVEQVKFLGPVGPGSRLTVLLEPQGDGCRFEVRHGERRVAQGRLAGPAAPSPAPVPGSPA
jgi:3-hydroxyacyl-[acyl-carrier-protein] dehydratase